MRSRGLNKKHLKALDLLKSTDLPIQEVAKQAGINRQHLFDLIAGSEKAGPVAQEFSSVYKKVIEDMDKRISLKSKTLRERLIGILDRWTEANCDRSNLSKDKRKTIVDAVKALTQGQPTYNIGSVSYSKGLSGEDIVNEFRRLGALAESALNGRGIPGLGEGRPGVLSLSSRARDKAQEGAETPSLLAEPEAGAIPQE
jgi:AraC-like DNA-binding protein